MGILFSSLGCAEVDRLFAFGAGNASSGGGAGNANCIGGASRTYCCSPIDADDCIPNNWPVDPHDCLHCCCSKNLLNSSRRVTSSSISACALCIVSCLNSIMIIASLSILAFQFQFQSLVQGLSFDVHVHLRQFLKLLKLKQSLLMLPD